MSKFLLLAIPLAFVVLGFGLGSQQFHWDTLERAVLLEQPSSFWRSWDGSPRSQFLSFAHVLELPLASIVRLCTGMPHGITALVWFELLCSGVTLWLLGLLVRRRSGATAAVLAQALLAVCWGFWKMGTSGEERILALATLLAFLFFWWRFLEGGRGRTAVVLTLALAILSHLSNAVLVPFALLGVTPWFLHDSARRVAALRATLLGTGMAGVLYFLVALVTTDVRTPAALWNYLTFFHRDTGNDFFMVSGSTSTWQQSLLGMRSFISEPAWMGTAVLAILAGTAARALWRPGWRQCTTAQRQLLLLGGLWSAHFVFYEPANIESWTVLIVTLILGSALVLRRSRAVLLLGGLAVAVLLGNLRSFAQLHRPMDLQTYHRIVVAASAPDDIVLLGGGIQNGRPLRGSHATRYFLAFERQRTIASLYDIMQITEDEFWGRPFPSLLELQVALEEGQRVWYPAFLHGEFQAAQNSGLVQLEVVAHGDSLYEVIGVAGSLPPQTR